MTTPTPTLTMPTVTTLRQGDQVMLEPRFAARQTRDSAGPGRMDWTKRVGTFHRKAVNGTMAHVLWQGNTRMDIVPIRAVVKVEG